MRLQVLVPPAVEPVNLAETKVFLQLDSDHEDILVGELIRTATDVVEQVTGRALINRTLRQTVKSWPDKGVFTLYMRPLGQLLQVQHVDADGLVTLVEPTLYYSDTNQARVIALSSFPRPGFQHPAEALQFDFMAGYGVDATAVPPSFRMAILLIIRDLYEHRGEAGNTLPLRAQALLAPFTQVRL